MESQRFDRIVSSLAETGNRRRVLGVLAASVGIGSIPLLRPDAAEASEFCLNGQTVSANKKKKKKKLKKQGATEGACPTSPPPSPPVSPPSPPPPPTPTKQYRQACTPGVDICGSVNLGGTTVQTTCGARSDTPDGDHTCGSTIDEWIGEDAENLCCVPPGQKCRSCDCCGDYECQLGVGEFGTCVPG